MSQLKTWRNGWRCDECCNGDRCDDPSHYSREKCPHCKGTGSAIWNMYAKEREATQAQERIAELEAENKSLRREVMILSGMSAERIAAALNREGA